MALLDDHPELDLYDREWLIHTRSEERAPAKVGPTAQVHRSLISPRLRDQRDRGQQRPLAGRARGRRCRRAGLDRDVRLRHPVAAPSWTGRSWTRRSSSARARSSATARTSTRPNKQEPGRLNTGITVVGKQSVVPRGARLGRNVKVGERVRSSDFGSRHRQVRRDGGAQGSRPAGRRRHAGGPPPDSTRRNRLRPPAPAAPATRPAGALGGVSASGRLRAMSSAPRASACAPADVEAWLAELGLEPLERADREGVTSWDLVLDGRRRASAARSRSSWIRRSRSSAGRTSRRRSTTASAGRTASSCAGTTSCHSSSSRSGEDERPMLVAEIPPATLDRVTPGARAGAPAGGRRPLPRGDRGVAQGRRVADAGPAARDGRRGDPAKRLWCRYAPELAELLPVRAPVRAPVRRRRRFDAGPAAPRLRRGPPGHDRRPPRPRPCRARLAAALPRAPRARRRPVPSRRRGPPARTSPS